MGIINVPLLLLFHLFASRFEIINAQLKYKWALDYKQSDQCSSNCGPGLLSSGLICQKIDTYDIVSEVDNSFCQDSLATGSSDIPILEPIVCNYGECSHWYRWRVESKWSVCSKTCGPSGYQTRDVRCIYYPPAVNVSSNDSANGYKLQIMPERSVPHGYCDIKNRPLLRQRCNKFDCPAEYGAGSWAKCPKVTKPCQPTRRKRTITCNSLQGSGVLRQLKMAACSTGTRKPMPASWESCEDHIRDAEDCWKKLNLKPKIIMDETTFIQMLTRPEFLRVRTYQNNKEIDRENQVQLHVGQEAYILPGTSLMIRCPVNYFKPNKLEWLLPDSHDATGVINIGKTNGRIRMKKDGTLRIKRFSSKDEGVWTCKAGDIKASISLIVRTPALSYSDWIYRNNLMQNDGDEVDPGLNDTAQPKKDEKPSVWVPQAWSKCSISCKTGNDLGQQTRVVRCERLLNTQKSSGAQITVYKDSVCESDGLVKPESVRSCFPVIPNCPEWKVESKDEKECSEYCVDVNLALRMGSVNCVQNDVKVDDKICDVATRPKMVCNNPDCQLEWKMSEWSPCSISCAENLSQKGIRARFLTCQWKNDKSIAGNLCYKNKLDIPPVFESCSVPVCKLICKDRYEVCSIKSNLCRYALFRIHCCKTCQKFIPKQ